jgi:hypothetical protein
MLKQDVEALLGTEAVFTLKEKIMNNNNRVVQHICENESEGFLLESECETLSPTQ